MAFARFLIILLILINLLVLAAWQGWMGQGGGPGEPQRLTNQLHPDRIHLLGERVAPPAAASAPSPPLAPTPATPVAAPAKAPIEPAAPAQEPTPADAPPAPEPAAAVARAADTAPMPPATPPACIAFAALNDEQSALLMGDALAQTGFVAKDIPSVDVVSWWVHLPSQGSREGAESKMAQLRSQGVKDLFAEGEKGTHPFAISLGLFKSAASAAEQQRRLEAKGVTGIAIEERGPSSHRVEVRGPADVLTGWASAWRGRLPAASRLDCAP